MWRVSLTAFIVSSLVLTSCGSAKSINTHKLLNTQGVATAIEKSILTEKKQHAKVTCPPSEPQQQGKDFVCTATLPNGSKTLFAVVQTDNSGHVQYNAATIVSTPAPQKSP